MRQLEPPRFVRDADHLAAILDDAKQWACPRCGRLGTLNGHGLLRGYGERTTKPDEVRGRRLLCSNRGRRPGCGGTFSVLLANRIRGFLVTTSTLIAFAAAVIDSASRRTAWIVASACAMSVQSGYRLWARISAALPAIRTRLHGESPPPAVAHAEPVAQLLVHVAAVCRTPGAEALDDFAALQLHFQRGLFD